MPVGTVGANTSVETGKQGMIQVDKEKMRQPGQLMWLQLISE